MPLSPRLCELSADELDLLQLVHNYGVVQAVLDRAAGSDLGGSRKIASLIERGYLRRVLSAPRGKGVEKEGGHRGGKAHNGAPPRAAEGAPTPVQRAPA